LAYVAAAALVIALSSGRASETVVDRQTGMNFAEQTPQSLDAALDRFERSEISPAACRARAEEFDQQFIWPRSRPPRTICWSGGRG